MNRVTLTAAMSVLRQKLSELFSAQRAPAGYQPGRTLGQLRRNLGLARFEQVSPTLARAALDDDSLHLEIRERTESQLLMHLVMTQFCLRLPASTEGAACFVLHHGGAVRRTGIRCRQRMGEPALLGQLQVRLQQDSALLQALMPLDFKRLHIELRDQQWHVCLEHMGGSEVVNRMPAFRRYIALSREQRDALLAALAGLQRVLRTL
ncbi:MULTISPECIES: DUF3156 family protein [unclassified Pseudomonas]|uniref:DUF3156 family protein n=1 Tax=unclassified Pseudomonas TaxID=196821 RepID=UPI0014764F96|nr:MULTISPECIES: DUF3156 family protein [unclassified Pseudomonas]NMX93836.1 DUF3156 family protein [Pseudomonas sp. WS 5086]NMY48507.1 DUF3156 family protein [Pseudomonas sp. WS 5027]